MNRTLMSGVAISLAMFGIFSCSGDSLTGTDGLNTDDLAADANLIASVSVSFGQSSIAVGDTTTATATLRDWRGRRLTNRVVTWSSSDNAVATVSAAGLVTGVSSGTAVITAARSGKSGSATITVTSLGTSNVGSVASVAVSLVSATLNTGQTTQASATMRDSANNVLGGRAVDWSSSNTSVATVSTAGLVTAVAVGTSQITATSEGKSGSAALSVTTPPAATTNPGVVQDLKASANDSTTVTLSFSQVDDGAGQPAKYDIRLAVGAISWGSATSVANGSCATPVAGSTIGSQLTCKVLGLKASTNYNFQLIAFRGTLNQDAVFGPLSNVVAVTTTASSAPPPPPMPVASVSISPASLTLQVGGTSQLTATTRDANNNILTGRTVTWSSGTAGIATVSATGVVTAVAAGMAQVTATSEGKSGSASITVAAVPPPPPPPPPGSSNEPAGMTLLKQRAFNSLQEDPSWDTDSQMQIIQDAAAPKSPSSVMRFTFPAGFSPDGNSNGHTGVAFGGSNRVMYISYWAKYSTNWQGHATGINKHVYVWNGNDPLFVMEAEGVGSGPLVPRPAIQRTVRGDGMYEPNLVPSAVIKRGAWFHIEVVLTGNTSGSANGSMDWWLDGVHVGSVGGLQWSSGTTNWGIFEIYPVWGGVGGTPVASTMTFDWDHVYLSGKP
jgi:uncharacterized protein YjdB